MHKIRFLHKRRRVHFLLRGITAVCLCTLSYCYAQTGKVCLFSISTAENRIYRYSLDPASGYLTMITPSISSYGVNPSFTAAYNNNNNLIVVNEGSNSISLYKIESDCSLIHLENVTTGAGPKRATISHNNKFMYVPNALDNTINQYSINNDGSVTPLKTPSVKITGYINPSGLKLSSNDNWAIITFKSMGLVASLKISSTGELENKITSVANTGELPGSPKFDKNGSFMIPGFASDNLTIYSFNADNGVIRIKQELPSFGVNPVSGTFLDDDHLYLSNLNSNNIVVFQLDDNKTYSYVHTMSWSGFIQGGPPIQDGYGHAYITGNSNRIWQFKIMPENSLTLLPIPYITTGNLPYNLVFIDFSNSLK